MTREIERAYHSKLYKVGMILLFYTAEKWFSKLFQQFYWLTHAL